MNLKNIEREGFNTCACVFQYSVAGFSCEIFWNDSANCYDVRFRITSIPGAARQIRRYTCDSKKAAALPAKIFKKYPPVAYSCLADY